MVKSVEGDLDLENRKVHSVPLTLLLLIYCMCALIFVFVLCRNKTTTTTTTMFQHLFNLFGWYCSVLTLK